MTQPAARVLALLAAVWLLLYRGALTSGALILGLAASVRLAIAPFAGFLLLAMLLQRCNWNRVARLAVGFALGALPLVWYALGQLAEQGYVLEVDALRMRWRQGWAAGSPRMRSCRCISSFVP